MDNSHLPSNRNFGLTIGFILLVVSIFFFESFFFYTLLIIAIFFILLGVINSKILFMPNLLWYRFGVLLSNIINPIFLLILYIILICPIALFFKFIKRDVLNRSIQKNLYSYWEAPDENISKNMDNQF